MSMKWSKPSKYLVDVFEGALPHDPSIERRQLFGCPCAFVNGNMFAGLHQKGLAIRLPQNEREELMKDPEAVAFEPQPGRFMREYVVLPPSIVNDASRLQYWMARALEYTSTRPHKRTVLKKRDPIRGV